MIPILYLLPLALAAAPASAPAPLRASRCGPVQDPAPPKSAGEWNARGIRELTADRYDAAIDAFAEARLLDGSDTTIRLNLSRAHAHRGRALLAEGLLPAALADFEAAAALDADGGHPGTLVAQALVRLGLRDRAQERLVRVIAEHPDNLEAHRLRAELEALAGHLDAAVTLLRTAEELAAAQDAPVAPIRERRLQLEEETRALHGFLTDASAHFDYRYDPQQAALVESLGSLMIDLEAAFQSVAGRTGLAPTDRVLVLLLDRDRYKGDAPEWSGGLYDGRIRVAVSDYAAERPVVQATLRHEYTHAALHRLGAPLPTWLHEGLAQWVEGRDVEAARRRIRDRALSQLPAHAALCGAWTGWSDRGKVESAYDYALSLTIWLGERYGDSAYRLLFENVRARGFEDGFRLTFGKSSADVDAEHRRLMRD
ncbi:MAG TPA: hypothetical protein VGC54_06110 [Planctomycetota bacterium]